MKTIWFKQLGPFYVPVHLIGYIITMLCILFIVPVWMAVLRNSYSINDDLCHIFVYTSCMAFWWKWIAEKTSN